jgi:hypothetical protein
MYRIAYPIADRHRANTIDIQQVDLLDQWCRSLGVTRQQLCTAVSTVGGNADLLRRHFHNRRRKTPTP